MGIIAGLDIGGSTTKIVALRDQRIICRELVVAADPVTSAYGAVGKLLNDNRLSLPSIDRIFVTGVGASRIGDGLFGIPTRYVPEFDAVGLGGLYLTGLDRAVIVSIGTGTAIVLADGGTVRHVIGSGVGGGTLIGLGNAMLHVRDFSTIVDMADRGDLGRVDLSIRDISAANIPGLSPETTASNFGKMEDKSEREDIALGIINMVFQSIGTMAVLAARLHGTQDIVCTGSVTQVRQGSVVLQGMSELYGVRFHIPDGAEYATALGAALHPADRTPADT
ncbi:MAG: type II pantothenate kinase [Clostridia bacterium]|nr:type II pantothenate kinase [Clostridia bacterium]